MKGVYEIRNLVTGDVYLGISSGITGRWHQHAALLERGKHYNSELQAAWAEYGSSAFAFRVIEEVDDDYDRTRRELELIRALKPQYNIAGTRALSEHIARGQQAQTGVSKQPVRYIGVSHAPIVVTEEDLGVYRCPCCSEFLAVVISPSGEFLVAPVSTDFVRARAFAYLFSDQVDQRIAAALDADKNS